jgi:hypothetical protein
MDKSALAIKAAQGVRNWGAYNAGRFAFKRGVPLRLMLLAMRLEAAK